MEAGPGHLRGHEARPDQAVQVVLVRGQGRLDHLGRDVHIHGPDGFVGVLRAALGLVDALLGRQVIVAELALDEVVRRLPGLVGDAGGVGTHVGDEGRDAAVFHLHAFVEALGDVHGALGRVGKTLVGGLLQGGGDEGRLRRALALLLFHALHHEGLALELGLQGVGLLGIADHGLLAADARQFRTHGGRHPGAQQGLEQPVFFRLEGGALGLALHDEAQGHGLHASGGDAALDGLPEQGRDLVAHQAVQHAPGLLGIEKVLVELARMGQGLLDGAGGDLVELDAFDVLGLVADQLRHMPGDGLPFAVWVGGQIDGVGLGCGAAQLADHVLLIVDDLVLGGKIVGFVHAQTAGRQVAHMAHAGLHHVLRSQKFLDGLHLGRRFHDDQLLAHDVPCPSHCRTAVAGGE